MSIVQQTEDQFQIPTYTKLPITLVKGANSWVWDEEGKAYLDFYGGHCVALLGHCPPSVVAAIQHQSETMLFYSNIVYSDVRAQTAQLLSELAPLKQAFFCNSGTEANETALKIARKYTAKSGVVATIGGFHGRTLGSLAVTWSPKYRAPYQDILPPTHFVPFGEIEAVAQLFSQRDDIAAFIIEPIQSIAGIVQAPDVYYQQLAELCKKHEVLLIFDEVQTGVGRTGKFSIAEHFGIQPDLITLAKSLGAGVPVGAVLASSEVAKAVELEDQGTTFGGGMLAMSAVNATLSTLKDHNLMQRASQIYTQIQEGIADLPFYLRGRGCLLGIESEQPVASLISALRAEGVLVGGSANAKVMRIMPPLTATDLDVAFFLDKLKQTIKG